MNLSWILASEQNESVWFKFTPYLQPIKKPSNGDSRASSRWSTDFMLTDRPGPDGPGGSDPCESFPIKIENKNWKNIFLFKINIFEWTSFA